MKKYKDIMIAFWQFLAEKPVSEIWYSIWVEEVDKSFAWLMLAIFGGLLLQFLLIFLSVYLQGRNTNLYQEILLSGMLPFFSSAVLISVLTDYYLDPPNSSTEKKLFKSWSAFSFGVVPTIFIVTSAVIVAHYFGKTPESLCPAEIDRLLRIQLLIFAGVIIYVFFTKLSHNSSLKKDNKNGNYR